MKRYNPTAYISYARRRRVQAYIGETLLIGFLALLFWIVFMYGVVTAPTMQEPIRTSRTHK